MSTVPGTPEPPPLDDPFRATRPACPFCDKPLAQTGGTCTGCGRDSTARRRVCAACSRMTPVTEPACSHCGARAGSELPLKVIIIVAMFVAALILSIVLQSIR